MLNNVFGSKIIDVFVAVLQIY